MIKFLLVEDDANLSYIVQSDLQDLIGGYEVVTAANGKERLKAREEFRPDHRHARDGRLRDGEAHP